MNWQTIFMLAAILFLIDGFVITPYALTRMNGLEESGIFAKPMYNAYGLKYFYISAPLILLEIFLSLAGIVYLFGERWGYLSSFIFLFISATTVISNLRLMIW